MARIVIEVPDEHAEFVGAITALAEQVVREVDRAKGGGQPVDYASIERQLSGRRTAVVGSGSRDPAQPQLRHPGGPHRDRDPR
jgi:hypothetical protein